MDMLLESSDSPPLPDEPHSSLISLKTIFDLSAGSLSGFFVSWVTGNHFAGLLAAPIAYEMISRTSLYDATSEFVKNLWDPDRNEFEDEYDSPDSDGPEYDEPV